ncbi:GPI ethanolamine phosphate transferase 3 [Lutzomyia longipalpis]|uniref:GPI ethanolamine phosphate transferase 3 n=1 Tax=Lutzomyia longipalpis TaxID=7200 RepID=UPI00248442E1|nr:GPI ethanolamine phosphate transferase 3 [Lutzomyia longipalpis]
MERHWRYFLVLLWIGFTLFSGIQIFSHGFLLTRVVQKERTVCHRDFCPPGEAQCVATKINQYLNNVNLSDSICLGKKSRVILLVIDALKYDFGIYNPELAKPLAYQNRMPIFSEILQKYPNQSRMMKFLADPPTTTLQRLKGLTTGSLPTFIDIGSNFASPEINEDNIIDQIVAQNQTAVFLGDSTWTDLFPGRFKRTYSYPSFNIFDLDTVDRRIEKYLPGEIAKDDWDLLIAHFLGVDHCGHKHGPLHREMSRKLTEMDTMVRKVIDEMPNDTMLIVLGDHGMTTSGDHGGDSVDELTSLIFAYSKGSDLIGVRNVSTMQQIDLVPTLAAIFGTPIPFSNLGTVNINLLPDDSGGMPRLETLLLHLWQNAKQVQKYFQQYAQVNIGTFRSDHIEALENKFVVLSHRVNSIYSEAAFMNFGGDLENHLKTILTTCLDIWVKFDAEAMTNGLLIAILTVFACFLLFQNLKIRQLERLFSTSMVTFIYASNLICIAAIIGLKWISGTAMNSILLYMAAFNILIFTLFVIQQWTNIVENWSEIGRFSNVITRTIYLMMVSVFFSNSFIIEEPKILAYCTTGMVFYVLFELKKAFMPKDEKNDGRKQIKLSTIFYSIPLRLVGLGIVAVVCLRMTYAFFRCREEHGNCPEFSGTHMSPEGIEGIAKRKLDLIAVVAVILFATLARIYLRSCGNLTGYSWNVALARYGPTLATICTCGYFLLSPKDGKTSGIPQIHIDAMAWIVGGVFVLQVITLVFRPLMIYVVPPDISDSMYTSTGRLIPDLFRKLKTIYRENRERSKIPIICGFGTVYSSIMISYFVVITILLCLLLGTKASIGLLVTIVIAIVFIVLTGILRYQTAKSLESCLQPSFATLVVWLLLTHLTFYTTSHQTTLSQIDWHPAFVGRTAYHDHNNILSAFLVIITTFCGSVLFGVIFPLITLAPFFIYSAIPNLATHHRDVAPNRRVERVKTSGNVEYRKVNISRVDETSGEEQEQVTELEYDITKGELNLYENEALFIGSIFKSACQLMALQGLRIFSSMLACTVHCRHLMVWKIFAPRFIYEGISTYVLLGAILLSYLILIRIHRAVVNLIVKFTKLK